MTEIQSQTELLLHRSRNLLKPSSTEIILYSLLALVAIIIYNSGNILQRLGGNYIGTPEKLKTSFSTLFDSFSSAFSTGLGGRLGQIIIWALLGAIIYIGIWLGRNVLNSFENDIIADHYLHPSTYSRVGYWGSSLSVKIFLIAMIFISLGYLLLAVRVILPSLSALAGSAAYNYSWPQSPLYMLFSVAGTALVLYIGVILLRIDSRLWKLL